MLKSITTFAISLILLPSTLFAQTTQPSPPAPKGASSPAKAGGTPATQETNSVFANIGKLQSRLMSTPDGDIQAQVRIRAQLAGWLLCLADNPDKTLLEGSVKASQMTLDVQDDFENPDFKDSFRTRSILLVALLLSPKSPQPQQMTKAAQQLAIKARVVDREFIHLLAVSTIVMQDYDSLWPSTPDVDFARLSSFKTQIARAIAVCEASFLSATDGQTKALSMACAAHLWRFMPCENKQERIQNLQYACMAYTAALGAIPQDMPASIQAVLHIQAAACWGASNTSQGNQSDRSTLIASAALLENALSLLATARNPALTGVATTSLCGVLDQMPCKTLQERVSLLSRQVALCQTALPLLSRSTSPELWQMLNFDLGWALHQQAQMSPQDKPALSRRAIAHIKAALMLNPNQISRAWHAQWKDKLLSIRKAYEGSGLDKDAPFDAIKPAQ